jgi:hypothetical protein
MRALLYEPSQQSLPLERDFITYLFIMGGVFAGIKPTFTVILPEQ